MDTKNCLKAKNITNLVGMILRCTENYLLVEIEKKFTDKQGGLFIDPTWTPEEYTTLNGRVYSTPLRVAPDDDRPIVGSVSDGDDIWFSYSVIFDYDLQPEFENPVYKNLVIHEGRELWMVHLGEVFCSVNESGEIDMVTDNILLTPADSSAPIEMGGLVLLGKPVDDHNKAMVKAKPSKLRLSCNMGDIVCIEPKYIQKYNILGAEHYIVRSRRVLAKM